jgi:DNA-directed RNA polymerase subunit N (RpoN/RPB10)
MSHSSASSSAGYVLRNPCGSCGRPLAESRDLFVRLTKEDGFSDADAMSFLGLNRTCCARDINTDAPTDQFEREQLTYGNTRFAQPAPRAAAAAGSSSTKPGARGRRAPPIAHLGGYEPDGALLDFSPAQLLLTDETPLRQDEADELPDPVEWDERSRVLALIWLMTQTLESKGTRVLYLGCGGISAGAMRLVLDQFDQHSLTLTDWHDVDPALQRLAADRKYRQRLSVSERAYTDAAADAHAEEGFDAMFCEYAEASYGQAQHELAVNRDMRNQLSWCERIQPRNALLRLVVPRISSGLQYPVGQLLLAPWTSPRNTDAYLALTDVQRLVFTTYDSRTQRQRMLYHDRVSRLSAWSHAEISEKYGIDACWDCAAECRILDGFVRGTKPNAIRPRVIQDVRDLTGLLSAALDATGSYTLSTPPHAEEVDEELEQERQEQ